MKILLSGASGLIGSALTPLLTQKGHSVTPLSRKGPGVVWDPEKGPLDTAALEGFEAVIHLAGESIADGRWNVEKKQRIRDSRIKGTQLLAEALTRLKLPPRTLICASAIGFYGNRGSETLRETSTSGTDFLAEVCRGWEASAAIAAQRGIRVVNTRFGIILSQRGGALKKMLLPFKLGVGGKIGPGTQYMSWVTLDDVLGALLHTLQNDPLRGPVNVVSPHAVTNEEFTKTLGRVLSRPTIFPLPTPIARIALGEMADALLLSSQKVEPAVLQQSGFAFKYPQLEGALRHLLLNN